MAKAPVYSGVSTVVAGINGGFNSVPRCYYFKTALGNTTFTIKRSLIIHNKSMA